MFRLCFLPVLIAIVFVSCNGPIRGDGKFVDETRNVADYTNVTSNGNFDVILTNDPNGTLRLHGESNVLPHVETLVDGDMLIIGFEEGLENVEHGVVRVFVPAFGVEHMTLQGSGSVQTQDTLDTPGFTLELAGSGDAELIYNGSHVFTTISGSGNVTLTGRANEATHAITGSGKINAINHFVHKCSVSISGFGDANVNCDSVLDASISGSGNVRYRGNPVTVNKHVVTGSGTVEPE